MMISKAEVRRELLSRRRAMDRETWLEHSARIRCRLTTMPELLKAARVHCYVSMERDHEVETFEVLEWLAGEQKAVFMPYIERDRMLVARYWLGQRFEAARIGPPHPVPLELSGEERFDAVIVPLAGFDRQGGRIGFGKGWYDRFFESLDNRGIRPARIGLAFDCQEVPSVPSDPWDQRLDFVVTETGIIKCLNSRS
ncbi:MAG TPA: 5-formyltetrahydrofolate cyclo-ligase [Chlorobaculum parvum]|uniref:5-formyltetrahydrofolate cyclo-ligase n=1 Tax=Chlorobaculum parvum TaxID=274539 RepID=A0A7C5DBN7_9CHLB|nr:5-formyltetrahydrofolate cyclo-ligase [Chlorobaculum parvum]